MCRLWFMDMYAEDGGLFDKYFIVWTIDRFIYVLHYTSISVKFADHTSQV